MTGNGTLLCLDRGPGADAALIVDGTRGDRGINEHAGNVRFGVDVFSRSASVSVSHKGVNAAELVSQLVVEIRDAVFALNAGNVEPWTQYSSPNQCAVLALDCRDHAHRAGDRLGHLLRHIHAAAFPGDISRAYRVGRASIRADPRRPSRWHTGSSA